MRMPRGASSAAIDRLIGSLAVAAAELDGNRAVLVMLLRPVGVKRFGS
jgi:hypothetical protein